ncbi:unnamed protein product, partial [Porites evermanni]
SHTLVIVGPTSSLNAKTVWGALRGLETFSQAVYEDETGFYLANGSSISDYPRFRHRGFMIDTSRHFLEPSVIFKFIEAMSYSKFNVLHWHVVDDQSFPFVSDNFPELSGQGAYNNKTHIYTKEDVNNIIEYARMHGIRVVPEFDTPGHTRSWGSIKNLLTPCYSKGKPSGSYGPINPTLDSTFTFLKTFFSEVAERFPDHYLHLGGDEVGDKCWASNPNITAWMQKMGYGQNYSLLEQHYEQNLLQIVAALDKSYIVWQEVVDRDIKVLPDTVVNIWKGGWKNEMAKVTSKGLRAILSSCWYLNRIHFGIDWSQYYTCDPTDFTANCTRGENDDGVISGYRSGSSSGNGSGSGSGDGSRNGGGSGNSGGGGGGGSGSGSGGGSGNGGGSGSGSGVGRGGSSSSTDKQKELVIGGTGCMWGEYVDGGNILPRTWPRALVVGERLWSSKETTNLADATGRLWEHRCRYVRYDVITQ